MFLLMDLDLFLVIPLALVWDIFVRKHQDSLMYQRNSSQYFKRQLLMGAVFMFFACLFVITYVIFNNYVDVK